MKIIEEYETIFLKDFCPNPKSKIKYIFALGPWVAIRRDSWDNFKRDLFCIWLKKEPNKIYEGYKKRWCYLKKELKENFPELENHPEFGCWDVDVIVDKNLQPLSKRESLHNICLLNKSLEKHYGGFYSINTSNDNKFEKNLNKVVKIIKKHFKS